MEYYSALKEESYQDKKKILRKLRWILPSPKKQKNLYCMNNNNKKSVATRVWREEKINRHNIEDF